MFWVSSRIHRLPHASSRIGVCDKVGGKRSSKQYVGGDCQKNLHPPLFERQRVLISGAKPQFRSAHSACSALCGQMNYGLSPILTSSLSFVGASAHLIRELDANCSLTRAHKWERWPIFQRKMCVSGGLRYFFSISPPCIWPFGTWAHWAPSRISWCWASTAPAWCPGMRRGLGPMARCWRRNVKKKYSARDKISNPPINTPFFIEKWTTGVEGREKKRDKFSIIRTHCS